ncbi:spermidine synthase [Motilimonas pumila]|uniref:SAM-dependent methyltransferase n=1 Tax=Motilimonas pumila TaxID=2303987 RepID=A0A418YH75_9GAMM|nr:hypothetical protein [Motilimonas pumila]RJG49407.1 hypothetical protein D1Z90_05455 [Motilimonas pumila]
MLIERLPQAQLKAYRQTPFGPLAIYEDNDYLWLCQDQQVQSLMAKSRPDKLLFSYQQAIVECLPREFNSLLELGLGGANLLRYLLSRHPHLNYRCIEQNPVLIDWFEQFFNPLQQNAEIVCQDAMLALSLQKPCDILLADLYDDYGSPRFLFSHEFYQACQTIVCKQLMINLLPANAQQLTQVTMLIENTFNCPVETMAFAGLRNRLLIVHTRRAQ